MSGGGTNLQAILDAVEKRNDYECRSVVEVISNSKKAYALERAAKARGIPSDLYYTGRITRETGEPLIEALLLDTVDR